MKKFILVGFQNNPKSAPKFLKEFFNGGANPETGAALGMLGFSSGKLKIQYSEGLENIMTFNDESSAGVVQQTLSSSWHGRHNIWCVRELTENTTITDLVKAYLKANKHIDSYKKALEEMA